MEQPPAHNSPQARDTVGIAPSYYDRKRAHFQRYQRNYAAIRRAVGHRKVSKRELKRRNRDALAPDSAGETVQQNVSYLAWKNGERDPESTGFMYMDEEKVLVQCHALKKAACDAQDAACDAAEDARDAAEDACDGDAACLDGEEAACAVEIPSWRDVYIQGLEVVRDDYLRRATQLRLMPGEDPDTREQVLHGLRRIIAGIHDEIVSTRNFAPLETKRVILRGCRFKKREFKNLYGF
ncbi:hypothetical protein FA95DRAFT_1612798 [Auriscalpium vulgare]|nr:hypothetical protein FA95DRAFT_1612798 [Auriscalpium vulgare]